MSGLAAFKDLIPSELEALHAAQTELTSVDLDEKFMELVPDSDEGTDDEGEEKLANVTLILENVDRERIMDIYEAMTQFTEDVYFSLTPEGELPDDRTFLAP